MPLDKSWEYIISDNNFSKVRTALSNNFTSEIIDLLSEEPTSRRNLSTFFDCHESTLYRRIKDLENIDFVEQQSNFSNIHKENSGQRIKTFYSTTKLAEEVLETYDNLESKYQSFDTIIRNDNTCYLLGSLGAQPYSESYIERELKDADIDISPRTVGRKLELLTNEGLITQSTTYADSDDLYILTGDGEDVVKGVREIYYSVLDNESHLSLRE